MIGSISLLLCCIAADGASPYIPPNLHLVQAETIKVSSKPGERLETGRLKITRVLAGPDRLVNKEFDCLIGSPFIDGSGFGGVLEGVIPRLETGASIWWVYEDTDLTVKPELRRKVVKEFRLDRFPYQQQGKSLSFGVAPDVSADERSAQEWKEGRAWAAAVGAVYNAKSDEKRRTLLEQYAAAADSRSSAWAMALLTRGPKENAARFLSGLAADERIHPLGQVALDELLCRLDTSWSGSRTRMRMLERWLACDTDKLPAGFASWTVRLLEVRNAGELDADAFLKLFTPLLRREDWPLGSLYHIGSSISQVRFTPNERDAGFKFLAETARTAKAPELRRDAARGLQQFRPLNKAESQVIRDLIEAEMDSIAIANLRVLLPK